MIAGVTLDQGFLDKRTGEFDGSEKLGFGESPESHLICDSQDLTLHAVLSDGDTTVRQTLGLGRTKGASLCQRC